MLRFLGVCVMSAMVFVGCGSDAATGPDAGSAPDSGEAQIDMGSYMFRDSSTATCANSGENCLGLPCCGTLMCIVPANGGSPTCNGFLSDGGSTPDAAPPADAAVDAPIADASFRDFPPVCLDADGTSPEGWYTSTGTFICASDCVLDGGMVTVAEYNECGDGFWEAADSGPGCDGTVILTPSVTSRRWKC